MHQIKKVVSALVLAFFCLPASNAQNKVQIMIVGSSHYNSDSIGYYREIIDKLKRFQPDMVFGEDLAPADLRSLEENNYGKRTFEKRHDYIQRLNPSNTNNRAIAKGYRALANFQYLHRARMDLAIKLIKNSDPGNGNYQVFILEEYMKPHFSNEELAYYDQSFGPLDSLKKVGLYRPNSEYHQIFFPLLYELGHQKIYPMDCQKYDIAWTRAWAKTDSLIKIMERTAKEDSTSPEARTLQLIETYASYTEEEKKLFDGKPYEGMNTDRYKTLDAAWNFYGGEAFYGFPGFPTEAVKEMMHYWQLRNEGMCQNILQQARAHKAERVIVAVGASHLKAMEEILEKQDDVELINFNTP